MIRRRIKQIALLSLAVLAVFFLHDRVRKEAELAPGEKTSPDAEENASDMDATQSMSVLRMGEGMTLGQIEANPDGEGIRIVRTTENGAEETLVFTDVALDSWYASAVNFVVSAGLMTGVRDKDAFQPEYGIQRENFAAILYRFTNGETIEPASRFEDVPEDSWYYDAVNWAVSQRLMSGLTPTTFGVGEFMTCEQALICLYRVAGRPETDGTLTDYPYAAKVTDSGRKAVDWAWKSGLITENECVWYPPQAISRAQVALLLTRFSSMSSGG